MRDSVASAIVDFLTQFEGKLNFMYCDQLGLVTVGVGNLIDPESETLHLPWQVPGRGPATQEEIKAAWSAVKARQDLKLHGGYAYKDVSVLRLSDRAVGDLVHARLVDDEEELLNYFPQFESFPADAQLGVLSMAWAMGAAFAEHFPSFKRAANSGDWETAASESHISNGAHARNDANYYLFLQASCAVSDGADVAELHWPPLGPQAA